MILNQAALDAATRGFKTIFQNTLKETPDRLVEIATRIPSMAATEDLPLGGVTGSLREWIGDREVANIAAFTKQLTNKDFERTIGIKANAISDDRLGTYTAAIQQLAILGKAHPYKLLIDELSTYGTTATGHATLDGKAFFAADHYWPGAYDTAQDNVTDETLDAAAVWTGIAAMENFRGPAGEPLDVYPTHFICAPGNRSTAMALFCNMNDAAGASNSLYGVIPKENIIIDARMSALKWALLDCSKPVKPAVFIDREPLQFTQMVDPKDSDSVWRRKTFEYGVNYRGIGGWVAWWLAYGSDGTES